MHTGKNYRFKEVVFWTRRDLFSLFIISLVPTFCYIQLGWKWLALPWLPIALIGTAVAFVVGFKNNASYDRMWEARRIWGSIVNSSRAWGVLVRDYISNSHAKNPLTTNEINDIKKNMIYRHFAWLTALRFQLREKREWEAIYKKHNAEYKNKWFKVHEHENKINEHVKPFLNEEEYQILCKKSNKAAQLLSNQSEEIKKLFDKGLIDDFRHMELEKLILDLYNHQGACERIKNFPYPRQYATLNLWFIKIFVLLIPFGMLNEFEKLGECLVWLTVPFSTLSAWIFTTLEKIGESSENPFEGSANDVPITAMSRTIEIDLREMMNDDNIPDPLKPENNILT